MNEIIKIYENGDVVNNIERDIIKFLSDHRYIEYRNVEQTPMGVRPASFIVTKKFYINVEVE